MLRTLARADINLLPFQLEPALALVGGRTARVLVADEVGLGKTVQAGLIVAETLERDPRARALIVTPAPLRAQWRTELLHRFHLDASIIEAASAGGPAAGAGLNPWTLPLVITSIDYLKRREVLRALEALVWDLLVVDEAHHVAGWSDRNAALRAVGARARAIVMLTGTPHNGDDEEFARLCAIGDIDRQFPLTVFCRTRQHVHDRRARRCIWLRVAPAAVEEQMHLALAAYTRAVWQHAATSPAAYAAAARLAATVLVKRACSSAAALARSLERRLSLLTATPRGEQLTLPFVAFPGADDEPGLELAAPGLADLSDERTRLQVLLGLARGTESGGSKVRAVARLLRRTGEPAIVFTEYRDTLDDVAAALHDKRVVQLHGGLALWEREAVLRQFACGDADVLLATDAAGEGLNLQHRCRLVVNLELPWTPVRLEQRVGRVDRIGQARRVHQVHLIGASTLEESHIAPLLRGRRDRLEQALDSMRSDSTTPGWNEETIAAAVFGGSLVTAPPSAPRSEPPALPDGVFVGAMSQQAAAEAARAEFSRRLARIGPQHPTHGRLLVTSGRRPRKALWAFRHECTDDEGDLLWPTVFGMSHDVAAGEATPAAVRDRAKAILSAITAALGAQEANLRAGYLALAGPQIAVLIARERAIARSVEDARARLADGLAQGALFSRSPERETAWRHDVLTQALRTCAAQLVRLERRTHPHGSVAPLFAIFLP
jgi:hypothetical protein